MSLSNEILVSVQTFKKVIVAENSEDLVPMAMLLIGEGHDFTVFQQGHSLALTVEGLQFLTDSGVNF